MQHSLTLRSQYSFLGAVVVSAGLLLSGCASKHPSAAQSNPATKQNEVQRRLAEILDAAEKADLPRLDSYHWYGPHFTKFASVGKRMDAATARAGEHKGLSTGRLKLHADELQVDVFNDTAVATFMMIATIQSNGNTVTKRERGTLVFARNDGSWRIVHEHFSAAE